MKTNLFKKSHTSQNSELMEMSKEEMKSIEGGIWYLIRNSDGTFVLRYVRD